MASIAASFRGTLYDLATKSSREVFLDGEIFRSDVGVGGGPIIPPGQPPGIWGGGNVPMPSPPIANVPGAPGYRPPGDGIWGPTDPRPSPPIANVPGLPPMPDQPPTDVPPGASKPPPEGQAGWGYYENRWGYFPGPGDAGPKG